MIKIVYSPQAKTGIKRIWRYIAQDNVVAADRLSDQIKNKIQLLKTMPEMGVRRPDIQDELRMLVHGNYIILYEFHQGTNRVEIVSVIEGMRGLGNSPLSHGF